MTINVSKPAINVREKLAELDKPTGIAGEAMLRAETPQEQQALVGFTGKRNYLFNGAMKVSQRGTSFTTTTAAGGYTLDRWYVNGDSAVLTVTQEAVSDLVGFEDSIKISPNATATPSNSHHSFVQQLLEAQDCTTFGYGLSGANHLTLSFWYKSNDTSTRVLWLYNPDSGRHYAQSFAPKSGGTWERMQFLIPPDTSGGFGNDNNVGLYVRIVFSSGSDFTGGMPNTGWTSINNARYEGVANLFSNTSNYIQITGVQLELGKVATPFEHRSYGEELALCQRYYWQTESHLGGLYAYDQIGQGFIRTTNTDNSPVTIQAPFPVTMRVRPAVGPSTTDGEANFTAQVANNSANIDTIVGTWASGKRMAWLDFDLTSNPFSVGQAVSVYCNNGAMDIQFDAEL
jgi:hypothetical protein